MGRGQPWHDPKHLMTLALTMLLLLPVMLLLAMRPGPGGDAVRHFTHVAGAHDALLRRCRQGRRCKAVTVDCWRHRRRSRTCPKYRNV